MRPPNPSERGKPPYQGTASAEPHSMESPSVESDSVGTASPAPLPDKPVRRAALLVSALLLALTSAAPAAPPTPAQAAKLYVWPRRNKVYEPLSKRIAPPPGFHRIPVKPGSFAHWLRHLPLLPKGSPVRSYDGRVIVPAGNPHLAAVVDLDVGKRDLQQCWDSVVRLRAEYLWATGQKRRIAFPYGGGIGRFSWAKWAAGFRPRKVSRRRYRLKRVARPGYSRKSFRRYLKHLFIWTGSIHSGKTRQVPLSDIRIGDFFTWPGSPGHAVLVVDLAVDAKGRKVALIGQGFMPAQDFHIVASSQDCSPWFHLGTPARGLYDAFWGTFPWKSLHRFR